MASFDEDIDYQFADKFMKVYEKICITQGVEMQYELLSGNPIITMAYVNKHPKKPWSMQGLTSNPSISLAYMETHPEKAWHPDEYHLRKYGGEAPVPNDENIASQESLDFIEKNIDWLDALDQDYYFNDTSAYSRTWYQISNNPNLTVEFIDKYYQKNWDHYILADNPLRKAKAQFKKEYLAAYTIQQAYARAKYIPLYAYCRKLHLQFYESMYLN